MTSERGQSARRSRPAHLAQVLPGHGHGPGLLFAPLLSQPGPRPPQGRPGYIRRPAQLGDVEQHEADPVLAVRHDQQDETGLGTGTIAPRLAVMGAG